MKRNTRKIVCSILVILIIVLASSISYGLDTGAYDKIYEKEQGIDKINTIGGNALAIAQTVGISVALVMLVVIGIKYVVSSPEQRASIKGKMIGFVIGAILLFTSSAMLGIIAEFARTTIK